MKGGFYWFRRLTSRQFGIACNGFRHGADYHSTSTPSYFSPVPIGET